MASSPTVSSILGLLTRERLGELARDFGVALAGDIKKPQQVAQIIEEAHPSLLSLCFALGRDELRAACAAHDLDARGRARVDLVARLVGEEAETLRALAAAQRPRPRQNPDTGAPEPGNIVVVRQRQYLVEEVVPPPEPGHKTLVKLTCLDDDAQGRPLEVLWELELGARVLVPEEQGLGAVDVIDEPRQFAAYLHALKWNCVTATDPKLFQAPFRAGIQILNHQLVPLRKALALPRVNLFIADDVGLGKTIEAGLVLQELLLRQRVDQVLIVCPASVVLQWRDEMQKRFGLHFEVYNRQFVARRRQERGFAVNPWATHTRFIISYQTLRRPEYREPLIRHLGDKARKSLLILDEAHTAAPASASKYAVDSRITRTIRELADKFEHRLFLSATPHNGHSNSFSALLELLDPQRFTRGVDITERKQLTPVMVRRLKRDLLELGDLQFPRRRVVQLDVTHGQNGWRQARIVDGEAAGEIAIGDASDAELRLSEMLAEYTQLVRTRGKRGRLALVNLQKRLLSSIEAFARTLGLHARTVRTDEPVQGELPTEPSAALASGDDDEYGEDDETADAAEAEAVGRASRSVTTPGGRARQLLDGMVELAERNRRAPGPKVLALLAWIREHQCPAVRIGGADRKAPRADRDWSDRRVIVFTEYGDTKRHLLEILSTAVSGTEQGEERILQFHGGMSDEGREEVQRAFNSPPDQHPVRILLCTDAAREGVNLQGHCADLFHFDVPWNPARMEQRNGRIDRTLQPAPEVRCHYFFYPQRPEDAVLRTLVTKVDHIQRELGSLSSVILDRIGAALEDGIDAGTTERLAAAEQIDLFARDGTDTLDAVRVNHEVKAEVDEVGKILSASERVMEFRRELLRDAINVGLELAGAGPLAPAPPTLGVDTFSLPEMPDGWTKTVDTLRRPQRRNEPTWEWRKDPPQPVVFQPPPRMNSQVVQLHLEHPFVQRILERFRAQGFSAHDLSRVTIVRNPRDSLARVIAFGRLSLFGPGATRLHEELVPVAAQWLEARGEGHLRPFADRADRKALDQLEEIFAGADDAGHVGDAVRARLLKSAPSDFATLWTHIEDEADSREHEARRKLSARGTSEAEALRQVLRDQRQAIERTLARHAQLQIEFTEAERDQQRQFEQDRAFMERRLDDIAGEIETQPAEIAAGYEVVLRRLEPVGLVYLWPAGR